jgi:hypothetical protein
MPNPSARSGVSVDERKSSGVGENVEGTEEEVGEDADTGASRFSWERKLRSVPTRIASNINIKMASTGTTTFFISPLSKRI